ncbi:MAG: nitrate/nitrite two-component system sensor histidine kinase NarQ [Vibrio casei]|uniref:nitrate/nitrite two-component system sensor histidine kinase NarQ n=1 Tax=Vibrio casei TaxID=673372 RepID=UPI003F9CDCA3
MNVALKSNQFSSPKKPIASTIAKGLTSILILALFTTGVALLTLSYSLKDAEIINVAGSLRMQSYRLAYDVQIQSPQLSKHITLFDESLRSPAMMSLDSIFVPIKIQEQYQSILVLWQDFSHQLQSKNKKNYSDQIEGVVQKIDHFVLALQYFSEHKLKMLAWVGGICLGFIFLITVWIIRFAQNKVVNPLTQLVRASQDIQNRKFDIDLNINNDTELEVLALCYENMAKELAVLYQNLEQAVDEKTVELQQANNALQMLYNCSKALSSSRLGLSDFQEVLNDYKKIDGIVACQLLVEEKGGGHIELLSGQVTDLPWVSYSLQVGDMSLGELRWQQNKTHPERKLMESLGRIVARALFFNHNQKQTEQLILMEERATIARELHDSLAQSLSYLKIQITLLKRNLNQEICQKRCLVAINIIQDVDEVLAQAYTQLRELLSTFRLQIEEADFGEALQQMLKPLRVQTQASLQVDNQLLSIELDAQQQVHLLQFIREAVLNAVKHANAKHINVECYAKTHAIHVKIHDDGIGFDPTEPKLNHYGLSIMRERASRLDAHYDFHSQIGKGCQITLTMNIEPKENHDDDK